MYVYILVKTQQYSYIYVSYSWANGWTKLSDIFWGNLWVPCTAGNIVIKIDFLFKLKKILRDVFQIPRETPGTSASIYWSIIRQQNFSWFLWYKIGHGIFVKHVWNFRINLLKVCQQSLENLPESNWKGWDRANSSFSFSSSCSSIISLSSFSSLSSFPTYKT